MTEENLTSRYKDSRSKTVGGAEVEVTERIFHHIMSNGPILKSRLNLQTASAPYKRNFHKSSTLSSGEENKLLSTSKPYGSSDLPVLSRNRSADNIIKRQMASECKLNSLHLSGKWASNDRLSSGYPVGNNIKQREVILEPPSHVHPNRGLSGSKVRKSSQMSKPGFLTQRNLDASESKSEILTPSSIDRSQNTSSRTTALKSDLDTEEVNRQLKQLGWNSSDQGLRLQREITYVNSSRTVKRASEVVSYRVDPMYVMSGFKIGLQNRYSIQEGEIKKLQEMTHLRETFHSNFKHLQRRPYSSNPSVNRVRKNLSTIARNALPVNRCVDDKKEKTDVQLESSFVLNKHQAENDSVDRESIYNENPTDNDDKGSINKENLKDTVDNDSINNENPTENDYVDRETIGNEYLIENDENRSNVDEPLEVLDEEAFEKNSIKKLDGSEEENTDPEVSKNENLFDGI
ncbi:CAunnamed protein product [Biomphalaria glabrata]|nr:CAunnamed protein product [Biomphalaria glabrata]